MRYDPRMVQPMRAELTDLGFQELLSPADVDTAFKESGTVLCVVNSVCGCAAGKARPGVRLAVLGDVVPDKLTTVFAGMELDAVERARSYFTGYPPSSPQVGLLKDGKLVFLMERHDIEGRGANEIAERLTEAFEKHCPKKVA